MLSGGKSWRGLPVGFGLHVCQETVWCLRAWHLLGEQGRVGPPREGMSLSGGLRSSSLPLPALVGAPSRSSPRTSAGLGHLAHCGSLSAPGDFSDQAAQAMPQPSPPGLQSQPSPRGGQWPSELTCKLASLLGTGCYV